MQECDVRCVHLKLIVWPKVKFVFICLTCCPYTQGPGPLTYIQPLAQGWDQSHLTPC